MTTKRNTKRKTEDAAKKPTKLPRRGSLLRRAALVLGLAGLGAVGAFGWQWMTNVRCERIALTGLQHADSTALLRLAQVDTGMVLFDIDPALVADRVRRHPWVQTARATRLPTGTFHIAVQERVPTVLVLDAQGRPAHYLDRAGYAMPLAPEGLYDVPLLRGLRERYHPVRRLQDAAVRDLLAALAALDAETDALVSELEIQPSGEVDLRTTPVGARGSLPVRLGRDDFAARLSRLHAFWHQAVLPQPDKNFQMIDLRFDGQIITQERDRGQ